jgi:hypothetical protein
MKTAPVSGEYSIYCQGEAVQECPDAPPAHPPKSEAATPPAVFETKNYLLASFLKSHGYYLHIREQAGDPVFYFKSEEELEQTTEDFHNDLPFGDTDLPGHFSREPLPLSKIVRIRCLDCHNGGWKAVRDCPSIDCNLCTFRLGRAKRGSGSRLKAIRRYCVHDCMNHQTREVRLCPTPWCWMYPYRLGRKIHPGRLERG